MSVVSLMGAMLDFNFILYFFSFYNLFLPFLFSIVCCILALLILVGIQISIVILEKEDPRLIDAVETGNKAVLFLHLDLGIGGAEQLVTRAATGLRKKGNYCVIYTTEWNPKRTFPGLKNVSAEMNEDEDDEYVFVKVVGNWIPRTIFGRFTVLMSCIRVLYACVFIPWGRYDVIINDVISITNPFLSLITTKCGILLFYCHYPDQLLCVDRSSFLKKVYRFFFDTLENLTIAHCDAVCVNSEFTLLQFVKTFPTLSTNDVSVLYPPVDMEEVKTFEENVKKDKNSELNFKKDAKKPFFLSLNRYERKKDVMIAIEALAKLQNKNCTLVVAGGYDSKLPENVE